MKKSFTHLHLHTEYSMLDGAARITDVIAAAAADGQPAIGITDHGNMYGVLDFYAEARKAGLTPVIGTEGYFVTTPRTDRPKRADHDVFHLTLLAESTAGYKNLIKVSSHAFLEGFYYKPRIDFALLEEHHDGLIGTTGCLGGVVSQHLMKGEYAEARDAAAHFQDVFGRDSFFVELQDHGLPEQLEVNPMLVKIARELRAPLLATNDSHYTHKQDAEAHDALLCVQTGAARDDPKRFKFDAEEFYLKTSAEMRALFSDYPEACDNTLWIAERARAEIEFGNATLPSFETPVGHDEDSYLRDLVLAGARDRYGATPSAHVIERIEYELDVIKRMGFSAYFLVVWDLVRYAKTHGIRVGPGRGSAAGSAVAYCLRIVDIDPIRYDLLFERFLNPGRKQMPDIDMDFDSRYRAEMIKYAAERYGWDRVAQIVTFSTIKARAAVRDSARVLGYPYLVGDKIAKLMPPLIMGRDTPLGACFEEQPKYKDGYKMAADLRRLYETDPDAKRVIDVARGLEGLRRQDGIHAAAVVITREPLTEYLPIQRKPEPGGNLEDAPIVTQYEMHGVEELGLLKMDFLGLRNLDVMEVTRDLIEESTGERPDIDDIPLDDPKTFEMLRRGDSIGVFQLEGGPVRALMRSLAPTSFEDVAALVALYRPGPMAANMHNDYADRKNGRKPVTYYHDDVVDIFESTFGLCLTGDTIVHDAVTGLPTRLDSVGEFVDGGGFWVQGVDDELGPVVRRVTHWVNNGEREVGELRLADGRSLRGTPDHRVLTERGWVEMGSLTPDDHVAVPRVLVEPVAPTPETHDRLRVLAYLIADGTLSVGAKADFTNGDDNLIEAFRASLSRAFPTVSHNVFTRETGVKLVYTGNGRGNGGPASPLCAWLRELGLKTPKGSKIGGCKSAEKFVPDFVFGLDDDRVARFLAALWDCDGSVGRSFAHYKTVSVRLARDVQDLLLRVGISSRIQRAEQDLQRNPGGSRYGYGVFVYDGPRFAEHIQPWMVSERKRTRPLAWVSKGPTIERARFVEAFAAPTVGQSVRGACDRVELGRSLISTATLTKHPRVFQRPIRHVVERLELDELENRFRVHWVAVRSVTPAGRDTVYDITVDDVHNFVANGIVAHNCIFQEQMMRMSQKLAGYSLEEADNLRKATGKKIRELIRKERSKFVDGCVAQGHTREFGEEMFDIIEPFADYSFNKSHSVGYGFVAYQTAYLKANHPREYLAALLTSVKGDKDKSAVYLNECRNLDIPVLVPDVNESVSDFAVRDGSIRFGLSAVRNVGEGLVALIIAARDEGGPFTDFYDFCERVDLAALNKRTIESLIKAGAFDSLGYPRQGLVLVFEQIVDHAISRRRERDAGIMSLFGDDDGSPDSPVFTERVAIPDTEFDKSQRLAFEKEMLGLYVSDHPMMGAERSLRRHVDCTLNEFKDVREGEMRTVGGVVTALARKYTKRGDLMATFVLEDLASAVEVMVFPKTMAQYGELLEEDAIVCVKGRLDSRDDQPKIIAMEVSRPELVLDGGPPVRLRVKLGSLDEARTQRLSELVHRYPGDSPVYVHLESPGKTTVLYLGDDHVVDARTGLFAELRVLFGADCIA
ncbi:MAG: DNA polymerase III subunit alpha [Acidimicrobiia bacterium]